MKHVTWTNVKSWLLTATALLGTCSAAAATGDVVFSETFDSEEALANWTIVDNNGGRTWEYLNGKAAYMLDYQTGLPGDDWLISPAFTLDETRVYQLTFYMGVASRTENLRVLLGTDTTISSFTTTLADYPGVVKADSGDKTVKITISGSGDYRLAFYAYSEANMHRVEVDNITVTEIGSAAAPGTVTDLNVVADGGGALKATVSCTAPVVTMSGQTLSDLTKVTVYRNGEAVYTFTGVKPGDALTWTDENATHGYNTYTVVATNSEGDSETVEVKLWVGPDNPTAPLNAKATLNSDYSITVTWDTPTGAQHDGYINFSEITYTIARNGEVIATGVTDNTYVDEVPVERGQSAVYYTITPYFGEMEGESATTGQVVSGEPVALPYHESFPNQTMTYPWTQDGTCNDFAWNTIGDDEYGEYEEVMTQDSDNGMIYAESRSADYGEQSRYVSPLFTYGDIVSPVMTFWFYYARSPWYDPEYEGEVNDNLQIQISYDGGEWKNVEDATFYINDNNNGWTQCQVYLPKQDCKFFNIALLATEESDTRAYRCMYVDNITIDENEYANDLAITDFSVDNKRVTASQPFNFNVTIYNRGSEVANGYNVVIYRDGEAVATFSGTELAVGASTEYTYTYTTNAADAQAESIEWKAEVVYSPDQLLTNNTAELTTSVRVADLPAPQNLAGSATDRYTATLTWDACTSADAVDNGEGETVTDDFESYEAFIIDNVGEWTLYDGDGATTLASPRIPNTYDHEGEPMAYQVFNNILSGTWVEDNYDKPFEAHSGNQYMMCPSADWPAENDDWLITPRLDGTAQTVSFYAKAATYDSEWIQIWYSTTDTHHDSFTALNDGETIYIHEGWKQITAEVPAGTRYVAVRCVRRTVFLFIDDFTYRAYSGSTDARTLVGYNIYRDGEKINDEPVTSTNYTDYGIDLADGHTYTVTAVYAEGESGYSNEVVLNYATGINDVATDNGATVVGIYSIDGKVLSTPQQGVNIMRMSDGTVRKVLVK